jgi:hypothetical protein
MKQPHFPPADVAWLIKSRRARWSREKAIKPLEEEYGSNWKRHGYRILALLSLGAFAETLDQHGVPFDVYGVRYDDLGWYVKVTIEDVIARGGMVEERIFAVSCHRLARTITTNDGEVEP